MDKNIVVLYHGPTCPDGFASALACWEYFGDTAEYVPVQYGKPVPQFTPDKHVYIVDFSYDAQTLEDLRHAAVIHGGLVTVLDHHASAQRDLQQYIDNPRPGLEVKFDMEESGASLTWKWLYLGSNSIRRDQSCWVVAERHMPIFYAYIRDRDLWRWSLENSRAVSMALGMIPKDFQAWSRFRNDIEHHDTARMIIQTGQSLCSYADQLITDQARNARQGRIGGYEVPIVNTTTLFSEVGNYLCETQRDIPFCAYYLDRHDGKRQWGLRGHGKVDLSLVAKQYGGGGHFNAAGFITGLDWYGESTCSSS